MIKAVLFDLDGTLVNSLYDLADAMNYCLTKEGFATHDTEKYKYFIGNGIPKLIERALPEAARTPERIEQTKQKFLSRYSTHCCDKTCLYDGINELLSALGEKGIRAAVITNKAQSMTDIIMKKLFHNEFVYVLGKRDEFPLKPDPASALFVMEKLSVSAHECLFVGDSGVDMRTAQNAEIKSVGVLWGFREREELLENGARYIIDEPLKLLEIIEELK